MAGLTQPRPAVFLFDETRTVQYAWVAQEWLEMFDYDEVKAEIDTLCGD
jgi:peroxiredoxin